MRLPVLEIDVGKIETNTRTIVGMCSRFGVSVAGVTKGACGHPGIARAMLAGGVTALCESRLENVLRLYRAGVDGPVILLRSPMRQQVPDVVRYTSISLEADVSTLRLLNVAAAKRQKKHQVLLMVDLGDLREGIMPDRLLPAMWEVLDLCWIQIVGIGANFACLGGAIPSIVSLERLLQLAVRARDEFGLELPLVSGGNSSALHLIQEGKWVEGVNHLRIGESILFGRDTVDGSRLPGTFNDTFRVGAEVIEVEDKPSISPGPASSNAFGGEPVFVDRGIRRRAVLALGQQDFSPGNLEPVRSNIKILGSTSDHLILDVTAAEPPVVVGDIIWFKPDYGALLGLSTSPYVHKVVCDGQKQKGVEYNREVVRRG